MQWDTKKPSLKVIKQEAIAEKERHLFVGGVATHKLSMIWYVTPIKLIGPPNYTWMESFLFLSAVLCGEHR